MTQGVWPPLRATVKRPRGGRGSDDRGALSGDRLGIGKDFNFHSSL
jgi:hypothetical protein